MVSAPSAEICKLEQAWTNQQEEATRHQTNISTFNYTGKYVYETVNTDSEGTQCIRLATEEPRYNSEYGTWMLNFSGRASVASRENFILLPCPEDEEPHRLNVERDGISMLDENDKRVAMIHYKASSTHNEHSSFTISQINEFVYYLLLLM